MVSFKNVLAKILGFIKAQFLPLAFLVAVLVAMLAPAPGQAVVSVEAGPFRLVEMINIIIVFFISGLTLNTKQIGKALKQWPGIIFGFITILLLTPLLGFAVRAIPYVPPEFGAGLTILCAAPTTLGVGAALVRQSKGNDVLAIFLLTGTNLLAAFTIPLWLKALLSGSDYNINVDIGKIIWQMMVTVVAPAAVGKMMRDFIPAVCRFATKYKEELSMFSVANLAFIVWQTLSGAQPILIQQQFVNIVYIILSAIVMHIIYLIINFMLVKFVFKMPVEEGLAVVIMGSQKSAPVAVTVITYLTTDVATQGLLSVPCIIAQLAQIFMGAAYAPYLAKRVTKIQATRKEKELEEAEASAMVAGDAVAVAVEEGKAVEAVVADDVAVVEMTAIKIDSEVLINGVDGAADAGVSTISNSQR